MSRSDALQFEVVKVALKQDATGFVLTLKIHPDEIPEELIRDFVGARYMVAMARLNDDEYRVPYKNRVTAAGMHCKDERFWEWLGSVYGEEFNEKSATEKVYQICGISSRTELNGNRSAQELFDKMMKDFTEWNKDGDPF